MSKRDSQRIVVLPGLEAVRRNPWMYVGSVSQDGAHQLLRELVYNSVDEALAGACDKIEVDLLPRGCRVSDDGRGIPTELHPQEGVPTCEVALTKLHAGSKFFREDGRFSAGLHGVGLSCVNALSRRLRLEVRRGGLRHRQDYARGRPVSRLKVAGSSPTSGTMIEAWPDPAIFKGFSRFDEGRCRRLLEDLSFLVPGVEFRLGRLRFKSAGGLTGLLALGTRERRVLSGEPLAVRLRRKGLVCEAALQWTVGGQDVRSFVNCVETPHGGTHVSGLRLGVARALSELMLETGRLSRPEDAVELDEACEGLCAILSIKLSKPNFESQTKTRLTNADVSRPIEEASRRQVLAHLRRHREIAAVVMDRLLQARSARLAARRASENLYFQRVYRDIDERVYKEQFGARSKNWHDSAVWITHEKLLKSHADLCEKGKDAVALDVCCGSGVVGASFKGKVKKVIGLDLTPEMVAMAKTRLDEVVQGTVYKLPFPDASFDLVCTREVLHLLPYPERPVAEVMRVLRPGGQFIVGQILPFSEDDAPWMFRIFKKKQPLIFNMFQEEDFKRLLSDGGFSDLKMRELKVWESIDVWIDSWETPSLHRHEIRKLFREAPAEARAAHPFKISPSGEIHDLWRWCVFSARKPA